VVSHILSVLSFVCFVRGFALLLSIGLAKRGFIHIAERKPIREIHILTHEKQHVTKWLYPRPIVAVKI
jgi:hypothetical protein